MTPEPIPVAIYAVIPVDIPGRDSSNDSVHSREKHSRMLLHVPSGYIALRNIIATPTIEVFELNEKLIRPTPSREYKIITTKLN